MSARTAPGNSNTVVPAVFSRLKPSATSATREKMTAVPTAFTRSSALSWRPSAR
jgi:hypothetical protein